MSLVREQARGFLRRLVLPIPGRDRCLNVIVPVGSVPAYGIRCLCVVVATYAWRAAHENGCSKIRVYAGSHKHEFDTIDLLKHIIRRNLGFFPGVKTIGGRVPALLATRGLEALGNHFDTTRLAVSVPVSLTPTFGGAPVGRSATHA